MGKDGLIIFEDLPIRKIEKNGKIWVSGLDVAKALEYENPAATLSNLLARNPERFEDYLTIHTVYTGNQRRELTFLNLKGVIAFCSLSKQKKAIPFQRWADSVLEKEILNIPEGIRLTATKKRVEFTDTLKEKGYTKKHEYIQTTIQMKKNLGIEKSKAECDLIQVMKIATAEMLARTNILQSGAIGYYEVNPICQDSAKIIDNATKKQKAIGDKAVLDG